MYNGIGLSTVRGSGTSGYVQRNLSHVPATKEKRKIDYKTEFCVFLRLLAVTQKAGA